MIKTTRLQREALLRVFQREFPSWISPRSRKAINGRVVKVPSILYRRFRATVHGFPGGDCIMVPWKGMWLGIEKDGYTHS